MTDRVRLTRPGLVDYETAWGWQTQAAESVRNGADEVLALLEHPPVFTFGRRVRPEHLLIPADELTARGAALVESDRGGDITFHGPGQVVGYPILNLRRRALGPSDYVRRLEEVLIRACAAFDVEAQRVTGRPGVWVGNAKVAAIGVRVSGGVTMHGFALNVETNLTWFAAIVPCGIMDAGVTSLERLLGRSPGIEAAQTALADAFEAVFDAELRQDAFAAPAVAAVREAALAHGH